MKPQWLERALFMAPYYTLCTTEAMFHDELRRLKLPREDWPKFSKNSRADAATHYLEHHDGKQCAIVAMSAEGSKGHTPIEIAGLLVHEAVHIWQQAAEMVGEDQPGREQEAYGVQTIAQHLMWEWVRQTTGIEHGA